MMKAHFNMSLVVMLCLMLTLAGNAQKLPVEVTPASNLPEAQDTVIEDSYHPVDVHLQVKNMHLWRGFKVTNGAMTGTTVQYTSKNGKMAAGLWGGAGFTGEYREFDYFIKYQNEGWNIAIWDINNFTGRESVSIFDYNPTSTSHFIDMTVGYQFPKLPALSISWSTIIQGRDFYLTNDGDVQNTYSNYVAMDYTIWEDETVNVHLFAGGAFAFNRQANFYGEKSNLVNVGISAGKDLIFAKYRFPVAATAMWNPEQNYGAIQFSINLF